MVAFKTISPKIIASVVLGLALTSCDTPSYKDKIKTKEQFGEDVKEEVQPPVVVEEQHLTIYSSRNEKLIKPLLIEYSNQTNTTIELITDKIDPLTKRLQKEKKDSKKNADVVITDDAVNLHTLSKLKLLQPFESSVLTKNVPSEYRDPKNTWTGLSIRARSIIYNTQKIRPEDLYSYQDLGNKRWKGKLCLRTSEKVFNKSLIASMIYNLGADPTKIAVKGWVKNLAKPVFKDDVSLLKAIASGECAVGIANTYSYARLIEKNPKLPIKLYWANQETTGVHINISGAGVITNAENPKGAQKLIEWLSSDEAQESYAKADREYPIKKGTSISEVLKGFGKFTPDLMDVAELGNYQKQTNKIIQEAKYK